MLTKDQQLSNDQSDILSYEFIELLLENVIYNLAAYCCEKYIRDKESERYLMTMARVKVMQGEYQAAV